LCDASGTHIGRIHNSITNYFVIDYADGLKRPLAETDASGTISRYYVWSGMRLLCHIEADGTTRYYHSDELGSTLALTDETGSLAAEFAYMPYGHTTASYLTPNTSNLTPFLWLGGYGVYYDSATDLHLTLHRAYSSKLKRFISPDPLGIDGGVNVYMWANMNPLFFVDPYGLCAEQGVQSTSISLIGAGASAPIGGFGSVGIIWDTKGNFGVTLNGEAGVGVEIGLKSQLVDLMFGHLPDPSEGSIVEQSGFGETARGHVLFGVTDNDPLNPSSDPEFSINPSVGGGVYKTGTLVIPVWGPDAPPPPKNYPMSLGYGYLPDL
jgi:RHS repeat-associated protein